MKPKEIINQLHIQEGATGKKLEALYDVLTNELTEACREYGIVLKGHSFDDDRKFDMAVKIVKSKWDAISIKIRMGLKEEAWKFFYATRAIALKEQLCPSWKRRKDLEKAKYEERQRKKEEKRQKKLNQEDL